MNPHEEHDRNPQHDPAATDALPAMVAGDQQMLERAEAHAEYRSILSLMAWESLPSLRALQAELHAYAHKHAALLHVEFPGEDDGETVQVPIMTSAGDINDEAVARFVEIGVFTAGQILRKRSAPESLEHVASSAAFNPPPDDYPTLTDLLQADLPLPEYRIDGVLIAGGNVLLSGQAKAAKTTLAINLVRCLLSGEDFLGLEVHPVGAGRRVLYWDCELERTYSVEQFTSIGISRTDDLALVHMKGHDAALMTAEGMEWTIDHLRRHQADVWIIDTLSRVFRGDEDNNSEVNAFLGRLDEIKKRAGVREIYLIHHAGHTKKGSEVRARGASALNGWPDTILTIEVVNPGVEGDTQRILRCVGRGSTVPEIAYTWDRETALVQAQPEAKKVRQDQATRQRKSIEGQDLIRMHLLAHPHSKKGDIATKTGLPESAVQRELNAMRDKGEVDFTVGDGRNGTVLNAKYYFLVVIETPPADAA